jgi:hypothetical protein
LGSFQILCHQLAGAGLGPTLPDPIALRISLMLQPVSEASDCAAPSRRSGSDAT